MDLKAGDVVLFNWGEGLYSWIIERYNLVHFKEKGFTHAGIISDVEDDIVWIHEAIWKKDQKDFQAYSYSIDFLENLVNEEKVQIRRPTEELSDIRGVCEEYEDLNYDWISILLMPFTFFKATPNQVFCSEGVGRILYDDSNKKINIAAELDISYEKLVPQHLAITKQLETIYGE